MILALPSLLLLGACTVLRDAEPAPVDTPRFPHPADFDQGLAHGAAALERGLSDCDDCHGVEGSTAPACDSCHADYPHQQGWSAGAVHGEGRYGDGGDASACEDCHAQEGLVASDTYSCTTCHTSYPHQQGWKDGGVHGVYALARGDTSAACGSCHGEDLAGGDVGVSCTECHEVWPHEEGWSDPSAHGAAAAKDASECALCHADAEDQTLWTGGTAGVACARCHASYPHNDGWDHDHMSAVSTVGDETICLRCHEPGDGPESMFAGCGESCHGGKK